MNRMSFICEGRDSDFENAVSEVLKLRSELLMSFDYAELLKLTRDDALAFVDSIKKNPGEHWQKLNAFLKLPEVEKQQIIDRIATNPEEADLPAVHLQALRQLSTLNDDNKERIKRAVEDQVNMMVDALDLKKLVGKNQHKYFGGVEISVSHIFNAIYEMAQRLSKYNGSIAYLNTWIRAYSSHESAFETANLTIANASKLQIVELDATFDDDAKPSDRFGAEDFSISSLEDAETEYLILQGFVEGAQNFKLDVTAQQHATRLTEIFQNVQRLFRLQQFDEVHAEFEEALPIITEISAALPLKKRQELQQKTMRSAEAAVDFSGSASNAKSSGKALS